VRRLSQKRPGAGSPGTAAGCYTHLRVTPEPAGRLSESAALRREHYVIFGAAWAGWVFDFYDILLLIFLVQGPLGRHFGWTSRQIGWIVGLQLASTGAGGVLFGWLGDRIGRKSALEWTILTYSLGTLFRAATGLIFPAYGYLVFWTIISGLGIGGEWGLGQNLIGETFPPAVRGRWGGYMQTGAPIGVLLAAVVGTSFAAAFGWRAAFAISVLPAFLVVVIRRHMPESDLWQQRHRGPRGDSARLLSPILRGTFLRAFVLVLFSMTSYWFIYSFIVAYVRTALGLTTPGQILRVFLVLQTGGFAGYALFGILADRFGRRPVFLLYCLVQAAGVLALTLVFARYRQRGLPLDLAFFAAGLGTGLWSLFGPYFSELFPTSVRATATGSSYNLARGIQLLTPIALSAFESAHRFAAGVALGAVFSLAAGFWIWTLPETRGKMLKAD
jgi:MFS family permease